MYIEFVILDNFVLTFLAGAAATRLAHKRVCVWRVMAASAVGTTVAVFYPFMRVSAAAELCIKAMLGALLCLIMYIKTPRFFASALLFFGCTFAFGGGAYAFLLVMERSGAGGFYSHYPIAFTLVVGAAMYICIRYVVAKLRVPRARAPYTYKAQVDIFGDKLCFDAFLDTGNCVTDERTGLPVIITDIAVFMNKLDPDSSCEFIKRLDRFRRINVATAAGDVKIYILLPDGITVYSDKRGHILNAALGIVAGGGHFSDGCEMLLCPAAMAEGV